MAGHPKRRGRKYVWIPKCSVYGLRDAPLLWNRVLHKSLKRFGLEAHVTEPCMYRAVDKKSTIIVLVYVDDLLYASTDTSDLDSFEVYMRKTFKIKVTQAIEKYVGYEVSNTSSSTKLHTSAYITNLAERFELTQAKKRTTPVAKTILINDPNSKLLENKTKFLSLLGGLSYVANLCRPDVCYIVNRLARFSTQPTMNHYKIAKGVLTYLLTTKGKGLHYKQAKHFELKAYTDSDWASEVEDRKSVTGYIVYLNDGILTYKTKKQPVVATSTMEAEFISICSCLETMKFLMNLLKFMNVNVKKPAVIYSDNQSAIQAFKSRIPTKKSKHIDIRFHKIKNSRKRKEVRINYVRSEMNPSDLLTKVVSKQQFERLIDNLVQ